MATANRVSTAALDSVHDVIRLFLMVNTFETGGSERQFAVLAQNLSAQKFQVLPGCIHRIGPLAEQFAEAPEFRLGGSLFGLHSLGARWRLARELRRHRVQIAHAFDFYTNLTLIPAARLGRTPVVIGSHRQIGDLLTPAQFRAQAAAFRWCDAVVCNSQAAAERLAQSRIGRDKLAVIGNALPDEVFAPATPAIPKTSGVLRVGMVARMNARYKGHSSFLRIAQRVHANMPNVEFLLAGDGPLRPELEREAEQLGLRKPVVFLGDRRDIPAVNASLDLAVLTSDSESLSNVILEAMAAGVPVIAYHSGGNPELISQERGALVPQADEEAFADAIVRFLHSPDLRERVGQNARKFASENFSLEHVLDQYRALYIALLSKKYP